jgi:DNA topoisomerase-1
MQKKSNKPTRNKTLLIVESPSKAKTISKYLGPEYIVRASKGHIMDLFASPTYKYGIEIKNNFKPRYNFLPEKLDIVDDIINSSQDCDKILIASDPDREGEAIAWHLAECLESTGKPIKRVLFGEITKTQIEKSIANPIELNKPLYDAQQARRVIDRFAGFLLSPLVSRFYEKKLSAGRVQSVVVKLIVDREDEIINFKPEEYYNVYVILNNSNNEKLSFKLDKKIKTKEEADKIEEELKKSSFSIKEIKRKDKKVPPNPPLITTTLSTEANALYGFEAAETMKLAQGLYESGFISYMRTDSTRISDEAIKSCREYLKGKFNIPKIHNTFANKDSSQDAHEAIRPSNVETLPENTYLTDGQLKIYKLIWEKFVASQMEDAVFNTVNITVKSSSGYLLKTSGKSLKTQGWMELTKPLEDQDEKEELLPNLNDNDILNFTSIKVDKKFTHALPRFSEITLIRELDKRGIGRPATYATILSKIKDRNYVIKNNNIYFPTDLGKQVTKMLEKQLKFMKYDYTSELEKKLDLISEGKMSYLDVVEPFYYSLLNDYVITSNDIYKQETYECPKCTAFMFNKVGKYGKFCSCYRCNQSYSIINNQPIIQTYEQLIERVNVEKTENKLG